VSSGVEGARTGQDAAKGALSEEFSPGAVRNLIDRSSKWEKKAEDKGGANWGQKIELPPPTSDEAAIRTFADPLTCEDLRGLPAAEQERRISRWVARERERGFELDEHPLIRYLAQRLDDDTFQFTYGFHHEIVDGWSEALLITELFDHYFSVVFDTHVVISPPRASMRDAIALELEALSRPENYEFWDSYLEGATLMRLPRKDAGPRADTGAREIVRLAVPVPEETSAQLKRLAIANGVPLKSVLLAALGGTLGVAFAFWGIRFLTLLLASGRENFTLRADLNWHVLLVMAALSLLTGIVFGLAPAIQSTRVDLMPAADQPAMRALLRQYADSRIIALNDLTEGAAASGNAAALHRRGPT